MVVFPARDLPEPVAWLLDGLRVVRSAWQKARAKKPQHSTCFDETIQ
jgi:hypothetical protein